jgi:uncharacterized OB-fold protein
MINERKKENRSSCEAYFRTVLPEVYGQFSRDCLKCGRKFETDHRFVRLCFRCKENQVKYKRHGVRG